MARALEVLLRLVLALVWIWSGVQKLLAPGKFVEVVEAHGVLPWNGWWHRSPHAVPSQVAFRDFDAGHPRSMRASSPRVIEVSRRDFDGTMLV